MQAQVPPHVFRAYDIRGLADADLHDACVERIARAHAVLLRESGGSSVAVGRDCRLSSPRIHEAFVRGLLQSGVDVRDLGEVPTPLAYYAGAVLEGVDGVAMITGSHNPPEYNGCKLGIGAGMLHGEAIQELRSIAEAGRSPVGEGSLHRVNLRERYLDDVRGRLRMGPRKLRVVVDAGNGMGGVLAAPLYRSLGVDFDGLYLEPDGSFPNHPADPAVEANLQALRERVLATGADLGIAFDGDADRLTVIDEKGEILWGDRLMIPFIRQVLRERPGATVIGEVKCSQTLFDEVKRLGGEAVMWKAGHSLIRSKLQETGAALAGEMSGHIFFADRWYGFDDGVYVGARLLELLSREERPLSALFDDVPTTYASPELRWDAGSEARKFAMVAEAVEAFRQQGREVSDVDGARVRFEDGWGLVRASNTQPILVLRYEAESPEGLRRIEAIFEETLSRIARG